VKVATTAVTLIMLVAMGVAFGPAIIGALFHGAVAAQVLLLGAVTAGPYLLGAGLRHGQRSALGLALGTRNFGAALAPLAAMPGANPRALVMIVLGVPVTVILSALAARWFGRDAARLAVR
jgi:hypothetical protein